MESERFRDSLLSGSLPLKVVDRPPDGARVFPFEYLVSERGGAPGWLRETAFAPTWRRFRDEFVGLPSLEEGLAAFMGLAPPNVPASAATPDLVRPEFVQPAAPLAAPKSA